MLVVPWDDPFSEVDPGEYDGLFLSNGPGDPLMLDGAIQQIRTVLEREGASERPKPIFGVCLSNQLIGAAIGAKIRKLKTGNRGHNQPCVDLMTGRCHLTMQNHSYVIDESTLPAPWRPYFVNANDGTNEGIYHPARPWFSVQFHPEAGGGPKDTEYLFEKFVCLARGEPCEHPMSRPYEPDVQRTRVSKVLLLGSGGLSIGQAGEFDYAGSQAIKAMCEEGIRVVLVNPNVATVQTTTGLADKVYFLPITVEYVSKVIEQERPDGIMLQFGGQTALNCGVELYKTGVLRKYSVQVLGTSAETIIATEDRQMFADRLLRINERIAPSMISSTVDQALQAADSIGYPVILRTGFALGGLGSGFASDPAEMARVAASALASGDYVLVEKSFKGWKEVEYEVVRDAYDNCVTVCNMENFDPLGIHTGESIVVAPSQTLSDRDYHSLRRVAIKVVRCLKVIGECNIQFACDPTSEDYYIVEVNARLSRSSALASKATGYPLAFVAAKLALGYSLLEVRNSLASCVTACFEPSLDYIVVKMPRWDLNKFSRVSKHISTSMKSVGEVMAIGRCFEEAIQKAIRMVKPGRGLGFSPDELSLDLDPTSPKDALLRQIDHGLSHPSDERVFLIATAFLHGYTPARIHALTKIDCWFLHKLANIYAHSLALSSLDHGALDAPLLLESKRLGFSDKYIAFCVKSTETIIRNCRESWGILPVVKQIDTVAAEYELDDLNYNYMTYCGTHDDCPPAAQLAPNKSNSVVVLGSGSYSIGSSVEFDWCAVSAVKTVKALGYQTIMINYNPETVSTDYDQCDKLYFEELSLERVLDICKRERPMGVIVSMGGQISNNIAISLSKEGVRILGTHPDMIEAAENRYKFSRLLDKIGVDQPKWRECRNLHDTIAFCREVGYPCLVRPSFVLSGAGMSVVHTDSELAAYLDEAGTFSKDSPIVISKFISNAKEIDVDAVVQRGTVIAHAILEHVENAGVHSGDAILLLPSQDLDYRTTANITDTVRKIAMSLDVSGPFNIQFIAKDDEIKVIECNLRASRSFPFVSKTLLVDFAEIATKVIMGVTLKPLDIDLSKIPYVGIKVPQFSFSRLEGADPILGVEMASTGEVACFGESKYVAFFKAMSATGFKWPKNKIMLLSIGSYAEKLEFLPSVKKLIDLGFTLYCTPGTSDYLSEHGLPVKTVFWNSDSPEDDSSVNHLLLRSQIDACIILPFKNRFKRPSSVFTNGYITRRLAVDRAISLITNIKVAKLMVETMSRLFHQIKHPDQIRLIHDDVRSKSTGIVTLPGLYDLHVHLREPGDAHKEDWDTGTAAALAGGITFVGVMPNTRPPITDLDSLLLVHKLASAKARCDYGLYLGASSDNARPLADLALNSLRANGDPHSPPPVLALKMYLNKTFTTLQLNSLSTWTEHFARWPKHLPICVHAELELVASVIALAHLHSRSVHICHVSRKDEILLIRQAKQKGVQVTCEVCPHHLFLCQDDLPNLPGPNPTPPGWFKVAPPLATKSDQDSLWDNIDVIDVISTDHAPHTLSEKSDPHLDRVPPGFPGLETVLPLMLTAVNQKRLTLDDLIQKMHTNPRKIFHLPEQPDTYLEVDLHEEWTIPPKMPYSKCQWTPYAGMKVKGQLRRVFLRGQLAMVDGKVFAPCGSGSNLSAPQRPSDKPPRPAEPPTPLSDNASLGPVPTPNKQDATDSLSPFLKPRMPPFHILKIKQFSHQQLHDIFTSASNMKTRLDRLGSLDTLKGKILANVFYEPSTRTSNSFHSAMSRLGGSVLSFSPNTSSAAKGEGFEDTIRTFSMYADVLVVRHPEAGSAERAAAVSQVPVINAGDGTGEHPTQALLDAFTIREELGTIHGFHYTFVGDLKHGRTVHSLVQLLSLYKKLKITYVASDSLQIPNSVWNQVAQNTSITQTRASRLEEAILKSTDVLYVTRIQKERFSSPEEYEAVKGSYEITPHTLTHAKESMILMHPLPRVGEIDPSLDTDSRAAYFRQAKNGLYVRMALLAMALNK